jgi:GntR family transcriptional repressor for pyruvate dehydrogenase complex
MVKKTLSIKPIQKQKIPEIIISELKDIIDSGQIEPGNKLPPERDLAGMLDVSRSSLRETLGNLSLLGILDNKSGKGTFLKTAPNRWPIEPFLIVSLESSNLLSMFEAHHELELVVVHWAAERRTKSNLKNWRLL